MSNAIYAKAKKGFLDGVFDLIDDTLKICLVKNSYSVDLNSHEFLSDIDTSHIAATSGSLSNKSTDSGIFDAGDVTIENYGTSGFHYLVLFKDTGTRSTSRLIAYIDTGDGLPVHSTVDTISITINWSNTISKIFTL